MTFFRLFALAFLLFQTACSTKQVKIVPFDPNKPVEVRRPFFQPGMYQQGEVFETSEMFEAMKDNKEVQSKLSWGRFYFFSGILLSGIAAGTFFSGETAADAFGSLAGWFVGAAITRYGSGHFLDIGEIHNRSFKKIRKPIESSVGIGVLPVADGRKASPGLVYTISL